MLLARKGKLLCCKCIFNRIKGNLNKIQPKNHQNVQKMLFLQKVPGVNGLICPTRDDLQASVYFITK